MKKLERLSLPAILLAYAAALFGCAVVSAAVQADDSLVRHWRLDESGGTVVVDDSRFRGNALLHGQPRWQNGFLQLDGGENWIAVDGAVELNGGDQSGRSVAVWFKVADKGIADRKQVIYDEGGADTGLSIYVYNQRLYVGGWDRAGRSWNGSFLSSAALQSNTWHHVSLVLWGGAWPTAGSLELYLDGRWIADGTGADLSAHPGQIGIGAATGAARFHSGAWWGARGHEFAGALDDLRIYNKALSWAEVANLAASRPAVLAGKKLLPPPNNGIYHAAFPDFGGWEDEVSAARVQAFENLTGKPIAWAYFSNNWWRPGAGIHFPTEAVNAIYYGAGRIPFIRMMPRKQWEWLPDPDYTMQRFIDGEFDAELIQWARAAKATGIPLLVEFGTECNGSWFPWNAQWNGSSSKTAYGDPNLYDGMERFRDAYRHIIDVFRAQGVDNVTWFFHVDAYNYPDVAWNRMAGYYPGDDYIDWIGVSAYGPQMPGEAWWSFTNVLEDSWAEISAISPAGKPIAILEWGVIDNPAIGPKDAWIAQALDAVAPGGAYYPRIKAISYWHEDFDQSNLRLDSSAGALSSYRNGVADPVFTDVVRFGR